MLFYLPFRIEPNIDLLSPFDYSLLIEAYLAETINSPETFPLYLRSIFTTDEWIYVLIRIVASPIISSYIKSSSMHRKVRTSSNEKISMSKL